MDQTFLQTMTDNTSLELISNQYSIFLIRYISIILINITSYAYVLLKFYKILCYSRMAFDWLPMINPYVWPFSMFHVLTNPYFAFWQRLFPAIKFERHSLEVSGIIGLEALNSLIYFCVKLTNLLVIILEETDKIINLNI